MDSMGRGGMHAAFWAAWVLAHAGAWGGSKRGGFIMGIMADGSYFLAQCGFGLSLAMAAMLFIPGWMWWPEPILALAGAMGMWRLNLEAVKKAGILGLPVGLGLGGSPLRLLQANVEGMANQAGWDFDVAAICEMWDGPLPSPEGMPLVAGAIQSRCDAAIYTRLAVLESGEAGPVIDGWVQAVWARLLWQGSSITVVSVHTRAPISPAWSAQRDLFLRGLASFVQGLPEGEPVVLAGDWNITPAGARFQEFMASGAFNQEPDPLRPTWRADCARFGLGFRIDRTLGAHGAFIKSWRALPKGPGDHLVSVSEIVFAK